MTPEIDPPDGDRKQPPEVKGEDDVPQPKPNGTHARQQTPSAPEPKNFVERTFLDRLNFGKAVVGWSIALLVILSITGYFHPRDSVLLSNSIEILKLICTTALGFVFARSLEGDGRQSGDPDN